MRCGRARLHSLGVLFCGCCKQRIVLSTTSCIVLLSGEVFVAKVSGLIG
jgi:hypothetical protein